MGFLDTVVVPNAPKTAAPSIGGKGAFFSGVQLPNDPAQAKKIAQLQSAEQVARLNAENANSTSGIVVNTVKDFGNRLVNLPIDFAKSLWTTYEQTPTKLAEDISAGAEDIMAGADQIAQGGVGNFFKGIVSAAKGVGKAGGRSAGDAAIAIFAPISSAIGAALTATNGQALIDKSGQVIADASGITDLPAFQRFAMEHPNAGEDFNRLLTLFLAKGEKGQIDPARITRDATEYAHKIVADAETTVKGAKAAVETGPVRDLTVGGVSQETPVSVSTPASRYAEYRASQGYEPYTPPDQLPTIQFGSKAKSADGLPVIQTEAAKARAMRANKGSIVFEPTATPRTKAEIAAALEPLKVPAPTSAPALPTPEPVKGALPEQVPKATPSAAQTSAEQAINTRAAKLDKAAVARKLSNGLKELPTHNRIDMEEQASLALEYARQHPEHALRIATGDALGPREILPEAIYTALETKAIREGDTATIEALTRSKIPTAAGQALKALDSKDPDSPVRIIRDMNQNYAESFKKKTGKDPVKATQEEVKAIKKEVSRVASKRPTWEEFIKEVQCTY